MSSSKHRACPLLLTCLAGHIWLLASVVPLLVRIFPIRLILRSAQPPRFLRPYDGVAAERIVSMVNRRLRKPRNMKRRACLRQGLLIFHFLKLANLPAVLHFTVAPLSQGPKRLYGHSFVTLGDEDMSPRADGSFVVILTVGDGT